MVSASFHLNNKEAKCELNIKINGFLSNTPRDSNLPRYEAGQDAHKLLTFGKLAREIDITHRILEVLYWYWLGC